MSFSTYIPFFLKSATILLANKFWGTQISYVFILIVSIVLSLISQIGDLIASSIKRYFNIKDFGNILPGHGGMLDRFDSVIFIAPAAYFLLMFI